MKEKLKQSKDIAKKFLEAAKKATKTGPNEDLDPALKKVMLGNFSCFCCRLLTFFEINFFRKFFQRHYQGVK